MNQLTPVHIVDNFLLNPTNPVTVILIGAGGTGSRVLTTLAEMNWSLVALGHAGLHVHLYDDDDVTEANLGRQRFATAELGLCKSVARINNINRFYGTNWKAVPHRFRHDSIERMPNHGKANIYISCVDTAAARFDIAKVLDGKRDSGRYERDRALYWLDMGNSRHSGQILLSTISPIKQPESEKYSPVGNLPFITEAFKKLLLQADTDDDMPSCSLAEALQKQDLFINASIANLGASLLWQMFREGMIFSKGFFLNLKDFRTQPIKVA